MQEEAQDTVIGDFRIIRQLGAGGMGLVYLARQQSLDRLVALKVLGQALHSQNAISRFKRESQAVAKLKHPSIAGVYYVGQDKQICYMAMEYIEGISLREAIQRLAHSSQPDSSLDAVLRAVDELHGNEVRFDALEEQDTLGYQPTPEPTNPYKSPQAESIITTDPHIRRSCEIVRDVALALHYAHEQGLVHRDVKPENIMLSREGKVFVIDFGLARFLEDNTLTNTGQLVGTPLYMSPEQVAARINVDHRTDIYSLGLVLYELLALRPPIIAPNRESLLAKIIIKELEPLSFQNSSIDSPLESVVHMAVSKDPDKRYSSAALLANDLENVLSHRLVSAPRFYLKPDLNELLAARPNGVVQASFITGFLGIGTFCVLFVPFFELTEVRPEIIYSKVDPRFVATLAQMAFFAFGYCFNSYGLYYGWRGAYILGLLLHCVSMTSFLFTLLLYFDVFDFPIEDRSNLAWVFPALFFNGIAVLSLIATRNWFVAISRERRKAVSFSKRKL